MKRSGMRVACCVLLAAGAFGQRGFDFDGAGPSGWQGYFPSTGPVNWTSPGGDLLGSLHTTLHFAGGVATAIEIGSGAPLAITPDAHGWMPPPLPIFPNEQVDVTGMQLSLAAPQTPVAAGGGFSATLTAMFVAGTLDVSGPYGNSTTPLAGISAPAEVVIGQVWASGTDLHLSLDVVAQFAIPSALGPLIVDLDGTFLGDWIWPTPASYCTAGTSSGGCTATIGFSGVPSASAGSGFDMLVTNVEGQKAGLVFYGVGGASASPWSPNSTSFLCVKSPSQRSSAQQSGGAAGACDGTLQLDWNAYIASHPAALGVPFQGGEVVWAQAWYRDPPAPKTTNLSDGLTFTVAP